MMRIAHSLSSRQFRCCFTLITVAALIVPGVFAATPARAATPLLSANFDAGTDGFAYSDDAFGTSQAAYASGARTTSGGYGSTGGLQVSLGGADGTSVTAGMSGGWSITLNAASALSGVALSFRYKLEQTATYEYDEYSRVRVKVDGVEVGRGGKSYVDHIGGDGSSTEGNSNSFLPTTDWQQATLYVGAWSAGNHTITLGGYNNKKDATDESTTLVIDDVTVTSDNAAPATTAAQTLAARVDYTRYLGYLQGLAVYHDRCRGSGMSCSSTDYSTNYMNALAWVEQQLQGMGYTTVRHNFTYNGNTGTNLWATKMGTVTPTQMYIVSGHLDGRGGGDAFDDDGSGAMLALETARVLAASDVTTDKSVRFCFWDKEELGLYGAYGYVQDRRSLQGTVDEPTWLGVIQHDMVLYDHGAGTPTTAQSAYADLDVEWRAGTTKETDSKALALKWRFANGDYAPDYPATAYNYSTNTDDTAFHPYVASVSVRENRRNLTSGTNAEWINPYYHKTTDLESSYTRDDDGDGKRDDIELGVNAVRTTVGLIAELAGAHIVNQPPTANAQSISTLMNAPVSLTLSGADPEGKPLTYKVTSNPAHGTLNGTPPSLTYTPAAGYTGPDSFTFATNDGASDSASAVVSITVLPGTFTLPFTDDFESAKGWTANPAAADSASAGAWERGMAEPTDSDGPKQLAPAGGQYDLVTGAAAGFMPGANDVDDGTVSVRSPNLVLPSGQTITLAFNYAFAHTLNASAEDALRVKVVGATTDTVLERHGAPVDIDAAWTRYTADLSQFAGQTVYLLMEATDGGPLSLVEAAVDDVSVTAGAAGAALLSASFDSNADGFAYADDAFRGTAQPTYAAGAYVASGGASGGGLQVILGGIDDEIVTEMSGGWGRSFTLSAAGPVVVSFRYKLTQSSEYEPEELSQALVSIDGALLGQGGDIVAQLNGNGNGGGNESTGWVYVSLQSPSLAAGAHTLTMGGYNNRKSWSNESTELLIDDVRVAAP